MNHDTDIQTFIAALPRVTSGKKPAGMKEIHRSFEALGISTVGDLWGCLHPELPKCEKQGDLARRCLIGRAPAITGEEKLGRRIRQLARAVNLPVKNIMQMAIEIGKLPKLYMDSKPAKSEWFLGQKRMTSQEQGPSMHQIPVRELKEFRKPGRFRKPVLLPDLHKRLGAAWDQGERGTCTAQAAGGLIAYLAGGFIPSTQFLYHQCKLIDGIPDEEGSYLQTTLQALSDKALSGRLQPLAHADMGVPEQMAWPYNPNFIPGNPAQTPPPASRQSVIYEGIRAFNGDGKESSAPILRCTNSKQEVVDEIRFLIAACGIPVLAGFPLYESFNNPNSRRTGKITLPLPGESMMGYHAMLIVGFDDTKQVFIVRNSWSTAWAWACQYTSGQQPLAGHAVIPYAYCTHPDISAVEAWSIRKAAREKFKVPPEARLCLPKISVSTEKPKRERMRGKQYAADRSKCTVKARRTKQNASFLVFLRLE